MRKRHVRYATVSFALLCLISLARIANAQNGRLACDDNPWRGDGRTVFCEIREQRLAAPGSLSVDGQRNGGVHVTGWDRGEMLVRAKVEAWADSDAEARALASQIRIETNGGQVRATPPAESQERQPWAVSYEIFLPHHSDLSLKTYNGGISVSEVKGQISFEAHNGGVILDRLAGAVKGETLNGGLHVRLAGNQWDGEGLDVQTRNGGIQISIPQSYSAHLEVSTKHGGLNTDFPVTVQGRVGKELSIDLGQGGRTVRAVTTNGGVSIRRQS